MMVVSTANGAVGIRDAMAILRDGGSALDAVEAGTRRVELNARDHTVGLGGLPNITGEVRLDASIMDGSTLRAGAVGSVRGIMHAITLARRVMERSPHVLLVADGAERFAREIGMKERDLLTEEAASRWREGLALRHPEVDPDGIAGRDRLLELVGGARDSMRGWDPPGAEEPHGPKDPHGTVNFLAQDRDGNLASAVSTSGYPWGYPGRLGDSPIIGAGGYADNRWGAAASTGTGEVVLRTLTTRSVVLYVRTGMTLADAMNTALADLRDLDDPLAGHIAVIALSPSGEHAGYSYRSGEHYVYLDDAMAEPETADMVQLRL